MPGLGGGGHKKKAQSKGVSGGISFISGGFKEEDEKQNKSSKELVSSCSYH